MAPTVFQIRTAKRMEIGWTVMKRPADRLELHDSLMLFGVVLFSALPYLFGLGFYSDDWAFQAMLDHASGQGVGAIFQQLLTHDASTIVRPVQVVYLVLGFEMFGRHPLPYHLVNTVVLGLAVVFLYLGLKEIRLGRWLAFVVAVVFGLLPHYSTDRFWIASHQATLSMAFAFIGIYALSRSMRLETSNTARWLALAVLALVLSILSYEVALGLIIASLLITGWRGYVETRKDTQRRFSNLAGVADHPCFPCDGLPLAVYGSVRSPRLADVPPAFGDGFRDFWIGVCPVLPERLLRFLCRRIQQSYSDRIGAWCFVRVSRVGRAGMFCAEVPSASRASL
jgi:hypothetical protein